MSNAKMIVKVHDSSVELEGQFQLETRMRTFFLRALSEDDLDQWVGVIQTLQQRELREEPKDAEMPSLSARCGYLIMRGMTIKTWRKRYFIFSGGKLVYYRTHQVHGTLK